uniref:Uncharacterized protein n=1 Tax=Anguilla anguilla TaxID=7936 RepID=A0A0E9PE10_ANGAN
MKFCLRNAYHLLQHDVKQKEDHQRCSADKLEFGNLCHFSVSTLGFKKLCIHSSGNMKCVIQRILGYSMASYVSHTK